MPRRFSAERAAAVSFALVRTAVCGWRAVHQSITVDEATTYLSYVRGPWSSIYSLYDANNHVLYSILAKLAVRWLRLSEFSLRLPSVLAGFFLVLGLYWMMEAVVPSRAIRWIALIALSLHPLLFDFSVAARGYGLAVTLLVWAVYFCWRRRDALAGVLLGLGVSANLTIAFPAAGLILCPLLLRPKRDHHRSLDAPAGPPAGSAEPPARGETFTVGQRRILESLTMAAAAGAVFVAICIGALATAHTANFYIGEPTIRDSLKELIATSVQGSVVRLSPFGSDRSVDVIQFFFLPAVAIFILAASARTLFRAPGKRDSLIPLVTLIAALAGLVVAHYAVGLNYPIDRAGLYLFPLFGWAWAIAAAQVPNVTVRALNGVLAGLLIVQFVAQFHVDYFLMWQFDASARQVADRLREECRGKPANSVSVSATWYQVPALEFYRDYYRITALEPVERHAHTLLTGFDYYVLNLKDDEDVRNGDRSRLIPLFSEQKVSGVLLAREPPASP
jgi:hypothetical protein